MGWFWGKTYETDIIEVSTPWYMLCFSYKWLGESRIHTKSLIDYPQIYKKDQEDDSALVKDLHKLFDEAEILVAHNGDRFDVRKSNARFVKIGLRPPSPYRTIDTLKAARKHFLFESNRLNDLGQYLGLGKKLPHTGFHLWKRCMRGDPRAWSLMRRYNKRDVVLLERVYEKLRPYMATHPNLNLYSDRPCCPACQSHKIQRRGVLVTQARKYTRYQCMDCGYWLKGKPTHDPQIRSNALA